MNMADKRISPLTWLSTKFASINHTHNNYLTSHQDITGKEDVSNKSSSISTDTGSTSKYPTVKAVEDYAQPKGNYLTQHQSLTDYVQKSQTQGLLKNDGTVDTSTYLTSHQSLSGYEQISNKVTSWGSTATNDHYPSEKLVKDAIDSIKEVSLKYFQEGDFLNPDCWYNDNDNYTPPSYSNNILSLWGWGSRFIFKDKYELPNEYAMNITLTSSGSPTLLINGINVALSSSPNEIYIYPSDGNTIVSVNYSEQTITGKMNSLEVRNGSSKKITYFSFNGIYPSNNLWDKK